MQAAPEQIGASLGFVLLNKLYQSDNQLLLEPFQGVIIIKESTPISDLAGTGLARAEPSAASTLGVQLPGLQARHRQQFHQVSLLE